MTLFIHGCSSHPEKLLTPKEAGAYLALSTKTVRELMTRGELAALRHCRLAFTSARAIAAHQQRKFSQFSPESSIAELFRIEK